MEMGTLLYCSMPPGDSPGMGRCHSPSSRAQDGRDSCRCAPWCTESAGAGALDLTQGSFGAKSSTVTFLFPASGCASPGPALHRGRGETAFSGHEGAHKPPTSFDAFPMLPSRWRMHLPVFQLLLWCFGPYVQEWFSVHKLFYLFPDDFHHGRCDQHFQSHVLSGTCSSTSSWLVEKRLGPCDHGGKAC